MRNRPAKTFLQYACITWLGVMLTLGQAFGLHMHIAQQHAGAADQVGQLHIASLLHTESVQTESHIQNLQKNHFHEINISAESHVNKVGLLVLAGLLLLVATLLFYNFRASRVINRFSLPRPRVSSLLYLLTPPLRAPPSAIRS